MRFPARIPIPFPVSGQAVRPHIAAVNVIRCVSSFHQAPTRGSRKTQIRALPAA